MFDSSQEALETLSLAAPDLAQKSSESTRVLEDRVLVLEQDHRRLGRVVEAKFAADAELADFRENKRYEDCFVIIGWLLFGLILLTLFRNSQQLLISIDGCFVRLLEKLLYFLFHESS